MALNPQVEALLALFAQVPAVDLATITGAEMRARDTGPATDAPVPAVAQVRELTIDLPGRTLSARLYVPGGVGEKPALVVYYHGGGWVVGSIETHDPLCRALANASAAAVLSVDYRLAPEVPFPGPLDDCHEALVWAHDHAVELGIDPTRLAVAGDSAGGNLATAVAMRVRDAGGPKLRHQLLIYPVTDADFTRPSYVANGGGAHLLSTAMMEWFWIQYLGGAPGIPVEGAMVLHASDLSNLAPATLVMAEYDPLCDEGVAYAEALTAAGNAVHYWVVSGMIHGFFSMFQFVSDAIPHIDEAGARLKAAFA